MNRIIFFVSLCFIVVTVFCQKINTKPAINISDPKSNDIDIISITTPRVLRYIPYSFNIGLMDTSNIVLEGRNVGIGRDYKGEYQMHFTDSSYYGAQIYIYRLINGNKTKIGQTDFIVHTPQITVRICYKSSGAFISLQELQRNSFLSANIENFDAGLGFKVKSFILAVVVDGTLIEIKEESNRLNEEQLGYIEKLKEGNPIIFKNIVIEKYSSGEWHLDPLVYFLKNNE